MPDREFKIGDLRPKFGSRHRKIRVGCGDGSGRGKTSTRGHKGQRSRSGDGKMGRFPPGQLPAIRRIPKRGFNNKDFRIVYEGVNVGDIARVFSTKSEVTLKDLRVQRLVRKSIRVKILGNGEVKKPIKIEAHAYSKSAGEKVKKAGGEILEVKFGGPQT